MKVSPEDSKPHFLLARIYDQMGQHDRARKERSNLARIQEHSGQTGMATADPMQGVPSDFPENFGPLVQTATPRNLCRWHDVILLPAFHAPRAL